MSADILRRQNIDATLLKTAVDQFIARDIHLTDDIKPFEELALGLLARLDPATAAEILRPLSAHPDAPSGVLARLYELDAINANHGAAINQLCELAADLSLRIDPPMRRTLLRAARDDRALARILLDRDDLDLDPAPFFLAATRSERLAIVLDACRKALLDDRGGEESAADPAFAAQFEQEAIARNWSAMAELAAMRLYLRPDRALTLITDSSGEALALLMRALGVDPEIGARIFLCADPAIAQNEKRIRKLVALMHATPQCAAIEIIVAIARETETTPTPISTRRPSLRATAPTTYGGVETNIASKLPGAA